MTKAKTTILIFIIFLQLFSLCLSKANAALLITPTCPPTVIKTIPNIIEAKRINPTSVFIKWGPYEGYNEFITQYGFQNNNFRFNTKVTGFSTSINNLPENQPVWIQVAATDNCVLGTFSAPIVIEGTTNSIGFANALNIVSPKLPNTGINPLQKNEMENFSVIYILPKIILFMHKFI